MLVSMACSHSHRFPTAFFNILLDGAYLVRLIGLKSIVCGVIAPLIFTLPLSARLSLRHQSEQIKMAQANDALSSNISEVIQGIRQVRFSSLETTWEKRILHFRSKELHCIWSLGLTSSYLAFVTSVGPVLFASISLTTYALQTGQLSPSLAFASLGLFSSIQKVLRDLPSPKASLFQSWVSCQRIQRFLNEPEEPSIPSAYTENTTGVSVEEATLCWPHTASAQDSSEASNFRLRDVNLHFPEGELSVVSGATGSGKSLLLAAILGEATVEAGQVSRPASGRSSEGWIMPGTFALVSQPPWIDNCSIKDNIVFGSPFNASRYAKVLWACALEDDLRSLPNRDLTMAGANGAFLSGGQRWRVALARAIYSRADILLFDDILSAVDTRVARWLLDYALSGELAQGRTRILATHNPQLCVGKVSYLVHLQNGVVTIASSHISGLEQKPGTLETPKADTATKAKPLEENTTKQEKHRKLQHREGQAETSAFSVWLRYLNAGGGLTISATAVLSVIAHQLTMAGHSWWLARWTSSTTANTAYYVAIYMILSVLLGAVSCFQTVVFYTIGLRASTTLFQQMIHAILRAPLRWIDKTPRGRLLDCFGRDMFTVDHKLSQEVGALLGSVMQLSLIIATK